VRARHDGLREEKGRDFGHQVCVYHEHSGQAASEGNSSVSHYIYQEVVPEGGRAAEGLPAQGEVNRREALGVGPRAVGAQYEEREGQEGCKRAVARLTSGGEQTVLRAAKLCFCDTRRGMGGRQDSITRMPMEVDEKQFVAHLCTLCQKVLSLKREPMLGVKRSAP